VTQPAVLLDEMLSPAIGDQLNGRGWDVLAVKTSAELIGLPDDDILVAATAQGRMLVTLNVRDFVPIERAWKALGRRHGGIVYVTTSTFPQNRGFIGAVVSSLVAAAETGQLPGPDGSTFLTRRGAA
jgi:Domain of unknown function (DUF5615)